MPIDQLIQLVFDSPATAGVVDVVGEEVGLGDGRWVEITPVELVSFTGGAGLISNTAGGWGGFGVGAIGFIPDAHEASSKHTSRQSNRRGSRYWAIDRRNMGDLAGELNTGFGQRISGVGQLDTNGFGTLFCRITFSQALPLSGDDGLNLFAFGLSQQGVTVSAASLIPLISTDTGAAQR